MTCRKRMDDVKTGGKSLTRDQSGGWPDCCPDGIRHEGGVTLGQALARNVGTCRPDAKEDIQAGGPCEDQSTDAGHRGGATRSSDEGQLIADFEADLSNNLYKIWNRMSSGSYFPPPV